MGYNRSLRLAIVTIANADTGSGSLVALTGSTNPIWYHGNQKDQEMPVATYFIVDGSEGTQSGKNDVLVQFTVWTDPSAGSIYIETAEDIRDRIEAIMTNTNLLAQGVNAAPMRPKRRDLPPGPDGIVGLVLDIEFFNGT